MSYSYLRRVLVALLAITYVFVSVGLLLLGVDHRSMVHCPFMMGEDTGCIMDVSSHVVLWRHVFTDGYFFKITLGIVIFFLLGTLLRKIYLNKFFLMRRRWPSGAPPGPRLFFTELFARGILHPKMP